MSREGLSVRILGEAIGFGRLMNLARDEWRIALLKQDLAGGEFAVGPCVALTVPCDCEYPCDWCNGCRWLTPTVKALKDAAVGGKVMSGGAAGEAMNKIRPVRCWYCGKPMYYAGDARHEPEFHVVVSEGVDESV